MEVSRAVGHVGYVRRRVRSQQTSRASIGVAVLLKPNVELEPCATGQRHAKTRLNRWRLVTMKWKAFRSSGSQQAALRRK